MHPDTMYNMKTISMHFIHLINRTRNGNTHNIKQQFKYHSLTSYSIQNHPIESMFHFFTDLHLYLRHTVQQESKNIFLNSTWTSTMIVTFVFEI